MDLVLPSSRESESAKIKRSYLVLNSIQGWNRNPKDVNRSLSCPSEATSGLVRVPKHLAGERGERAPTKAESGPDHPSTPQPIDLSVKFERPNKKAVITSWWRALQLSSRRRNLRPSLRVLLVDQGKIELLSLSAIRRCSASFELLFRPLLGSRHRSSQTRAKFDILLWQPTILAEKDYASAAGILNTAKPLSQ
ncbi:uncharacterized protein MCYG_04593 [Microsporum canis CBS 113480]|uniref:Uncharacterized protein n=1 Tax=Arthroderma otae (strain ATCC MYA-4605 / CBS 113480) TaxID=554155 RepID=C5FNS1_ARTOC|nr:uncharacterized protein MCYG_04593 [Microsporum canis CBS 113480]EEQ31774.1 predicted protein [Microsporum canis CBS 113480]